MIKKCLKQRLYNIERKKNAALHKISPISRDVFSLKFNQVFGLL